MHSTIPKILFLICKYAKLNVLPLYIGFIYLQEGGELFPVDENGKTEFSYVDYVDTWKAMEILTKKGLTRSIGLSNFNKHQIQRILDIATVPPVNNQVFLNFYIIILVKDYQPFVTG